MKKREKEKRGSEIMSEKERKKLKNIGKSSNKSIFK